MFGLEKDMEVGGNCQDVRRYCATGMSDVAPTSACPSGFEMPLLLGGARKLEFWLGCFMSSVNNTGSTFQPSLGVVPKIERALAWRWAGFGGVPGTGVFILGVAEPEKTSGDGKTIVDEPGVFGRLDLEFTKSSDFVLDLPAQFRRML